MVVAIFQEAPAHVTYRILSYKYRNLLAHRGPLGTICNNNCSAPDYVRGGGLEELVALMYSKVFVNKTKRLLLPSLPAQLVRELGIHVVEEQAEVQARRYLEVRDRELELVHDIG